MNVDVSIESQTYKNRECLLSNSLMSAFCTVTNISQIFASRVSVLLASEKNRSFVQDYGSEQAANRIPRLNLKELNGSLCVTRLTVADIQ